MKLRASILAALFVFFAASYVSALEATIIAKQSQEYLALVSIEQKPLLPISEYRIVKKSFQEFMKKPNKSKEDIAKMEKELQRLNPTFKFPEDFNEFEKELGKTDPQLKRFPPYAGPQTSLGSGFFVNIPGKSGFLITNNHVINHPNAVIKVKFKNKYFPVKIIGRDSFSDLAILEVRGVVAKPASLGDSDALEVGQSILVIGNPRGLLGSVSQGVVSGLKRSAPSPPDRASSWPGLIQTDASIDFGNSGGPLVETKTGKVVGVVNATIQSFGFAIPSNVVKRFTANILKYGKPRWGFLGAGVSDIPIHEAEKELAKDDGLPEIPIEYGALIREVRKDSPADKAGLKAGDVVAKVGDELIDNSSSLVLAVALSEPKTKSKITVMRSDRWLYLEVFWGERPAGY